LIDTILFLIKITCYKISTTINTEKASGLKNFFPQATCGGPWDYSSTTLMYKPYMSVSIFSCKHVISYHLCIL